MVNPKLTWGVWIEGTGWLKRDTRKAGENPADVTFASESKIVAEGAAELWGQGATVRPIDASLIDLEATFLERRKSQPGKLRMLWVQMTWGPAYWVMQTTMTLKYKIASKEFETFLAKLRSQSVGGAGFCATGYHWDDTLQACVKDTELPA